MPFRDEGRGDRRRGVLARSVALALVLLVLASDEARAAWDSLGSGPVHMSSDLLHYERQRDLYIAEGNVRIEREGRSIEADWVVFSRATERGVASGNVHFVDGDETLDAAFLQFDLETLRGLVYRARLDTGDGGFLVDADRMIKTGDDTYTVRGGMFTTCRCEDEGKRDPWAIETGKANVELGEYATAQNTTLEILGVPVVWLPWLIFPIKTERESGVLFPDLNYTSRVGFEIGLPLFWAAHDQLGVTVTPRWLSKRGVMAETGLEYVWGERSSGAMTGTYLKDQERKDDLPPGADPDDGQYTDNRWSYELEHDQYLPKDWRLRAHLRLISDNEFLTDFEQVGRDLRFDRYLESVAFGFNHFGEDGNLGLVAQVNYADDRQNVDSLDRDPFLLQRYPRLTSDLLTTPIAPVPGLAGNFGFEYTYFKGHELAVDNFEVPNLVGDRFLDKGVGALEVNSGEAGQANGVFDEGEPLADNGHRFVLHPRLAYPVRLFDLLEVDSEIGYRQALYTSVYDDFSQQGHLTGRVDLRTRVERSFETKRGRLQHVVEPVLGWTMFHRVTGDDNPLFVPQTILPQNRIRLLARENILLDPSDDVDGRQAVSLGVANRFYRAGHFLGEVTLAMDYNWMQGRQKNYSRFVVDGLIPTIYGVSSKVTLAYDPDDDSIEEGMVALYAQPLRWFSLSGSYRFRERMPRFYETLTQVGGNTRWPEFSQLSQLVGGARLNIGFGLTLHYAALYDFSEKELLRNAGGFEYRSRCECWAFGVTIQDQRDGGVRYQIRYSLLGIGDDRLKSDPLSREGGFKRLW